MPRSASGTPEEVAYGSGGPGTPIIRLRYPDGKPLVVLTFDRRQAHATRSMELAVEGV